MVVTYLQNKQNRTLAEVMETLPYHFGDKSQKLGRFANCFLWLFHAFPGPVSCVHAILPIDFESHKGKNHV